MKEKIFAGLDLAWTVKNETGICFINEKGEILLSDSGVYSNADVSYLMLLGTCLLPDFPVEKIENTDKFMVENELSVKMVT